MTLAVPGPDRLYRFDRSAEALAAPDALTDAHVDAFRRDGFVAVENVLTLEEVGRARQALDDLIHGRVSGAEEVVQPEPEVRHRWDAMDAAERADSVRKLYLFVEHEPRLNALTLHPAVHGVLERLLGEPCHLIQDMALLKPPFIGTEKPWHQDAAYFGWAPFERIVGVWIALDPATPENGCMHVLPGTHLSGPVPHVHERDCQIPDERVEVERDVLVPLAPGGALFFSALVHHGTPPNRSPRRRWAVQFHYAGRSARPIDRREHAALYFEQDHYAGCRGGTGTPLAEIE